jgi:Rrf2 family transcriptional regulator, iron-sulfur cluster assembly transcription factor
VKLSTQADYAVRAVFELALRGTGVVVHTDEIAAAQHIPSSGLAKVIRELSRAEVVRTQRGNRGGIVLARPAADITVREVYEAVEGPVTLCRCRATLDPCDAAPCDTHEFWSSVETLLSGELEQMTFAVLTERRDETRRGSRPQCDEEVNQ